MGRSLSYFLAWKGIDSDRESGIFIIVGLISLTGSLDGFLICNRTAVVTFTAFTPTRMNLNVPCRDHGKRVCCHTRSPKPLLGNPTWYNARATASKFENAQQKRKARSNYTEGSGQIDSTNALTRQLSYPCCILTVRSSRHAQRFARQEFVEEWRKSYFVKWSKRLPPRGCREVRTIGTILVAEFAPVSLVFQRRSVVYLRSGRNSG